jgi:hypothetical protein
MATQRPGEISKGNPHDPDEVNYTMITTMRSIEGTAAGV